MIKVVDRRYIMEGYRAIGAGDIPVEMFASRCS
jgi:hypothetical protein